MTKHSKLSFRGEEYTKHKCNICDYTIVTADKARARIKLNLHFKIAHKEVNVMKSSFNYLGNEIATSENKNYLLNK